MSWSSVLFPEARRPHDDGRLAAVQHEVDVGHGGDGQITPPEALGHAREFQHGHDRNACAGSISDSRPSGASAATTAMPMTATATTATSPGRRVVTNCGTQAAVARAARDA